MLKATTLRCIAPRGFTLVELMVVILIIGILAAFAVPQYQKSIENTKAENAIALTNMIATASRMYALDHGGISPSGYLSNSCNTAACVGSSTPPGCDLVACKYLPATDFDGMPYIYNTQSVPGSAWLLLTNRRRKTGGSLPGPSGTDTSPYTQWSYRVNSSGVISINGNFGQPAPTQ